MKKQEGGTTVALESLGCKLNQAEIQQLERQLADAGYRVVSSREIADVYILNTCTVTHVADRKSRHMLRTARRRNPAVRLVAIGCYAERDPRLGEVEGLDLVVGDEQKWQLPELLNSLPGVSPIAAAETQTIGHRTRAFVRVQSGCRFSCAYCIVPAVRSREECVPAGQVIEEIGRLAAAGYREVVLTGTEVGTYYCDGEDLNGLLRHILAETTVARIRLSSLQPQEVSPELLRLWQDHRLCPHFHLSLQSGSARTLRRMRRRYSVSDYQKAIESIRNAVPGVAITTDIIVGFPGETDADFKEGYEFCLRMGFARIHVFPFSARPGTAAADFPDRVPLKKIKERSHRMLELAEESARAFHQEYLGKTMSVLFEKASGGIWDGLTGNYIRVYGVSREDLTGQIRQVRLERLYRDGVWGEIISGPVLEASGSD